MKEIDLQRLKDKYTVDGKALIKPEKQARFLGVDEFKLHNGYKYASLLIDMESGHTLWLAHGKRKRIPCHSRFRTLRRSAMRFATALLRK